MLTGSSFRYALQVLFLLLQLACHKTVDFTTAGVHQVEENSVTVVWLITSRETRIFVTATSVSNPGKVIVSMHTHTFHKTISGNQARAHSR